MNRLVCIYEIAKICNLLLWNVCIPTINVKSNMLYFVVLTLPVLIRIIGSNILISILRQHCCKACQISMQNELKVNYKWLIKMPYCHLCRSECYRHVFTITIRNDLHWILTYKYFTVIESIAVDEVICSSYFSKTKCFTVKMNSRLLGVVLLMVLCFSVTLNSIYAVGGQGREYASTH